MKKVEQKRLHPGAVLENGATLEVGAIFFLIIMFRKKMAPLSEVTPRVWCNPDPNRGLYSLTMKRLQGWSRFGSTFFLSRQ